MGVSEYSSTIIWWCVSSLAVLCDARFFLDGGGQVRLRVCFVLHKLLLYTESNSPENSMETAQQFVQYEGTRADGHNTPPPPPLLPASTIVVRRCWSYTTSP